MESDLVIISSSANMLKLFPLFLGCRNLRKLYSCNGSFHLKLDRTKIMAQIYRSCKF